MPNYATAIPHGNPPGPVSAVTGDGSVVEIYRRMPSLGEVERIHSLLPPRSSVLDLGAGTGRIANALTALGHRVTAVDDSAEMLEHVRCARTVQARIEDLRLAERFDAVLLISSLINYPDTQLLRSMLASVTHHLAPAGKAIIEWSPPSYFAERPTGWTGTHVKAGVTMSLAIHSNRGGVIDAELVVAVDDQQWCQRQTMRRITLATLRRELARAGLVLTTAAPESTRWLQVKTRHEPERAVRAFPLGQGPGVA